MKNMTLFMLRTLGNNNSINSSSPYFTHMKQQLLEAALRSEGNGSLESGSCAGDSLGGGSGEGGISSSLLCGGSEGDEEEEGMSSSNEAKSEVWEVEEDVEVAVKNEEEKLEVEDDDDDDALEIIEPVEPLEEREEDQEEIAGLSE